MCACDEGISSVAAPFHEGYTVLLGAEIESDNALQCNSAWQILGSQFLPL